MRRRLDEMPMVRLHRGGDGIHRAHPKNVHDRGSSQGSSKAALIPKPNLDLAFQKSPCY